MDRKRQLSNVAFGGAWSEPLAAREALIAALEVLDEAARGAGDADPRELDAVRDALDTALADHPKADMLRAAWARAAARRDPGIRIAELVVVSQRIAAAHTGRLGPRP